MSAKRTVHSFPRAQHHNCRLILHLAISGLTWLGGNGFVVLIKVFRCTLSSTTSMLLWRRREIDKTGKLQVTNCQIE